MTIDELKAYLSAADIYVTPYLNEEFRLWQGNHALLTSCFDRDQEEADPARIIMNRVKDMLSDFSGFLVIT